MRKSLFEFGQLFATPLAPFKISGSYYTTKILSANHAFSLFVTICLKG